VRRHPDQRDALIAAFGMLDRMEVGIVEVDQEKAIRPRGTIGPLRL
jgi:hypothetical protein